MKCFTHETKLLTILLSVEVLESLSDVGSKDASGELLGDPVDIGEGEDGAGAGVGMLEDGTVGAVGASNRSKKGFLLLLGDENGLVLPIVANFCPELNGLLSAVADDWTWSEGCVGGDCDELGGTKLLVNGLVLLPLTGLELGESVLVTLLELFVRKLSENKVSRCRPARPFSEKCVTLMGRFTLDGDKGVSREEMVSRSTLVGGDETVVVVKVGELSTSIS